MTSRRSEGRGRNEFANRERRVVGGGLLNGADGQDGVMRSADGLYLLDVGRCVHPTGYSDDGRIRSATGGQTWASSDTTFFSWVCAKHDIFSAYTLYIAPSPPRFPSKCESEMHKEKVIHCGATSRGKRRTPVRVDSTNQMNGRPKFFVTQAQPLAEIVTIK